jgi:hypothetical protein
LEIENDIIEIMGRVLDQEEIYFGTNFKIKSDTAEWQRYTNNILRTVSIQFFIYNLQILQII